MAQFGGNKNPPWARGGPPGGPPGAPGMEMAPGLMGFGGQAGPPVFQAQGPAGMPPGLAQALGGPGGPHNPAVTLGAAMAAGQQAFPRPLGPPFGGPSPAQQILQQQQAAAAVVGASLQQHQQQQQQQQQQHGPPGPGQPSQRVFTGTVTKLHDNFGFVDEDVFFQTTVVKGQAPRVNDRVLVEAGFNPNMPFKWNATRIQVLPNQRGGAPGGGGGPPVSAPPPTTGNINPTATPNNMAFSNASGGGGGGPGGGGPGGPPKIQGPGGGGGGGHMGRGGDGGSFGGGGGGRDHGGHRGDHSRGDRGLGGGGRQNNSPMRGGGGHKADRPPDPPLIRDRSDRRGGRGDDGGGRDGGGRGGGSGNRDRDRERSRDKDRSSGGGGGRGGGGGGGTSSPPTSRKRSRSPRRTRSRSRSRSPPRRRQRTTHRYNVSVPRVSLNFPAGNVMELKKRYGSMYVPSDFFLADHVWNTSFPIHRPFRIQYATAYHVFNKELVEPPRGLGGAVFDPPDADYTYSVKVMLMATPSMEELFDKTCAMADTSSHAREHLTHPTRAIQFLVGMRGKNETMAIGGPWSPSLDGPNPDKDPSVLVRTAIRACRALTGIDLSGCTQWKRFLEIHYRRQETSSKPARTETTVIFLPDVWSVMPTASEFPGVEKEYAEALEVKLHPELQKPKEEEKAEDKEKEKEGAVEEKMETDKPEEAKDETATEESKEDGGEETASASAEEGSSSKATPWQELDVKSMKVNELREELEARGLNSKGLKSQLAGRLQKAVKEEQEAEAEAAANKEESEGAEKKEGEEEAKPEGEGEEKKPEEEAEKKDEEMEVVVEGEDAAAAAAKKAEEEAAKKAEEEAAKQPKPLDEKQKAALTAAYKFPSLDSPCILVHPSPKAKSGKFDCSVVSLSVLLDYRTDDNKEGTFEVSLFAELFNEMLVRDSGFRIYRAVVDAPAEKAKEEKKEKKEKEEKEKEKEGEEGTAASEAGAKEETSAASAAGANVAAPSKKEEEKPKKMVTVDKDLLLACSYFDLGHSGYFETKDLEDIISTVNLNLSRAQIKKLVSKAATSKDQVNYRTFTDKAEDAAAAADKEGADMGAEEEEEEVEELLQDRIEQLGKGFKAFLPGSQKGSQKRSSSSEAGAAALSEGMCTFEGSVVDVKKLVSQLRRSETARSETEARLNDSTRQLTELREAAERHTATRDKLQGEVRDLKKRLRSSEDEHKRSQQDSNKYFATLKEVFNRVNPHIQREREEKEKEKAAAAAAAAAAAEKVKKEKEEAEAKAKAELAAKAEPKAEPKSEPAEETAAAATAPAAAVVNGAAAKGEAHD